MSNPIRPTVGRVVYFMPGIGCNLAVSKAGVLAALITAVHTDDCINLAVFDANGEHHALSSVNHESIAAQYVDGRHSCWDWMPYQKEQVAKVQPEPKLFSGSVGCAEKPSLAYCEQTGSLCNAEELAIEQQIQAKGLNAPRLTPADIDRVIVGEDYHRFNGTTLTTCCLYLANGFTVTGESACASPENFNEEIGRSIAKSNAREKIWQLEGYLLRQCLYEDDFEQAPICVPSLEDVAEACHEINRAYCLAIGDDSQSSWADAPEWQRSSAINGVKFHLANPDASPSASHDSWLAQKTAEGWKYGLVKNPDLKEHPCFVPYSDLPAEQKAKDYLFKQTVHSFKPFIYEEPQKVEESSPHNTVNS